MTHIPAKISAFVLCLMLAFTFSPAFADGQYAQAAHDLPLMPGMVEQPGIHDSADDPGRRVVRTSAAVNATDIQVLTYYYSTLTPLGWKVMSRAGDAYYRDDEMLNIRVSFNPATAISLVRFDITPYPHSYIK